MNIPSDQVEKLLRRAPRVAAPSGLLERLKSDIKLAASRREESAEIYSPSFFRRWLPALSMSIWLLACLVILAVQSNMLSRVRSENEALRAAKAEAQQQVTMSSSQNELMRLRADNEEVQRLRAEVTALSEQLKDFERLRAENQRLAVEVRKLQPAAATPQQDFFTTAARKQENMKCINNLKQVGLGARMWANDHNEVLPSRFDQMQNELLDRNVLFCPASDGTVQYEIVSPGAPETDPQVVYARCPRDNNVVLCDGSAQMLGDTLKLVVRPDGKTVIGK